MANDYFYFSDQRFHFQALKTFLDPRHRGFYVNFHAHKRYPFLESVYKLMPDKNKNKNKKDYLENLFIRSIAGLADYHSSSPDEYTKCLEALFVNSTLYSIVSSDIIVDNILSIGSMHPIICFSSKDTLMSLFATYLVAYQLQHVNINFKLVELNNNITINPKDSLVFLYNALEQAIMPDEALINKILFTAVNYGSIIITDCVKQHILSYFDPQVFYSFGKNKISTTQESFSSTNVINNIHLSEQLLSKPFAFVRYLSSHLINSLTKLGNTYSPIANGKLYLSCAPIAHTPSMLIIGRLFFTKIYLLPHSDIPSYEIPHQMYDYQIVVNRPRLYCDPCGQNPSCFTNKEIHLDEV